MVRLCVAGAVGRMGRTLLVEAISRGFQITGAVESPHNNNVGKSLREIGLCNSKVILTGSNSLGEALKTADVYVTFTTPNAEISNIPVVAELGKRIVMGTTGFTHDQMEELRRAVEGKVPVVFSPNYSLGVNVFFNLARACNAFPPEYDFSITETHHTEKRDAPSGTAKKLANIVSSLRGYSVNLYGREGLSPRESEELEILSIRAGGVPGIHNLVIAGPYEMLRIEHTAFSRKVFAQGALYAAEWVYQQSEPGVYSMEDVLQKITVNSDE